MSRFESSRCDTLTYRLQIGSFNAFCEGGPKFYRVNSRSKKSLHNKKKKARVTAKCD